MLSSNVSSLLPRLLAGGLALVVALAWAQKPFREYPSMEGASSEAKLPPDFQVPADFVLGRLMYESGAGQGAGQGGGRGGRGGGSWTVDYPRGDRTLAIALRRLTRIDVRSVEQPVSPDDGDDIYNWPYLHVGMPSNWNLSDAQAAKIRQYLLRGGFLLGDSFFGTREWEGFEVGMKKIFPDREIIDIPESDAIFSIVYGIKQKYQVGNFRSMQRSGGAVTYRADGKDPQWRGIRDDQGRMVAVMTFNNDLGDSWQLADNPEYPVKFSDLGIRLAVNFVTYTLTH